jgi:hypothetical protein
VGDLDLVKHFQDSSLIGEVACDTVELAASAVAFNILAQLLLPKRAACTFELQQRVQVQKIRPFTDKYLLGIAGAGYDNHSFQRECLRQVSTDSGRSTSDECNFADPLLESGASKSYQ